MKRRPDGSSCRTIGAHVPSLSRTAFSYQARVPALVGCSSGMIFPEAALHPSYSGSVMPAPDQRQRARSENTYDNAGARRVRRTPGSPEERETAPRMCPMSTHAENCLLCKARKPGWFCNLAPQALAEYDAMSSHVMLPMGSIVFAEGQPARSVSVVCDGRIKLTRSSRDGKTLLVKIAKPGDVLGLSAALSKTPYEVTAQAIEHAQIKTFQQSDFLHFIKRHVEGSLHAAESLSNEYRSALK